MGAQCDTRGPTWAQCDDRGTTGAPCGDDIRLSICHAKMNVVFTQAHPNNLYCECLILQLLSVIIFDVLTFTVRFATSLCTTGAGLYGSILINICILTIALLICYKPNKIFIPFVLVVAVILPPVGLIWAWWLVREKVPAVSAVDSDKCEFSFVPHLSQ